MWTRGGAILACAVLMIGLQGCASRPGAAMPPPTSEAAADAPVTPQPGFTPTSDPAAEVRAQGWVDGLPVPPEAVPADSSPSELFAGVSQGWICVPMVMRTAYWVVKGMSPAQTLNWMAERPAPGLVSSSGAAWRDDSIDIAGFGETPEPNSPYEGIVITVARTDDGSAIRAVVGARAADAVCQTPPPGETFGGIGQG